MGVDLAKTIDFNLRRKCHGDGNLPYYTILHAVNNLKLFADRYIVTSWVKCYPVLLSCLLDSINYMHMCIIHIR